MTAAVPHLSLFFPICTGNVPICSRFSPDVYRVVTSFFQIVYGIRYSFKRPGKGSKQAIFPVRFWGIRRATLFGALLRFGCQRAASILPEIAPKIRGKIVGI
jgi:hypothetical protein